MNDIFKNVIVLPIDIDFISYISNYILEKYSLDLDKVCLIFSGKRPSLFLKKNLAASIKSDFYPPVCFSVDDFVTYIVSKKERFNLLSEIDSIYLIYNILRFNIPSFYKKFKSFLKFLPWGREIFYFIEELFLEDIEDNYLKNIKNLAEIGFEVPKSLNELLKNIEKIKEIFYQESFKKKSFTRGMLYNYAKEICSSIKFEEFKEIIYCAPFYLYNTEINIIKNLSKNNNVVLFIQTDGSYWKTFDKLKKHFKIETIKQINKKPNIYFFSSNTIHAEISTVKEILKDIKLTEKTVIVIPQVEVAIPLISEISFLVKEFNLACGYPLKRSSVYSLLKKIFNAQLTKKFNKYYTKDYLSILKNSIIKSLNFSKNNRSLFDIIVEKIDYVLSSDFKFNVSRSAFIDIKEIEEIDFLYNEILNSLKLKNIIASKEDLKETIKLFHKIFFFQWENIKSFKDFSKSLKSFINIFKTESFLDKYPLNSKIIDAIDELSLEIENSLFFNDKFKKEEIFQFFIDQMENKKITILGSPLKGLQILGFYETRNLSFDNVIILDLNEGILPNVKLNLPLIPREILSLIGINRLDLEEEIQFYHFKRLIFSSKNVYLFFVNSEDKERSRFLEQLLWETQKEHRSLDAVVIKEGYFDIEFLQNKNSIKKTNEIIEYLKKFEYSSSSIDTYLKCPFKFYLKYVLKLKEKEDFFEEPESKEIGEFIHKLLKISFEKFLDFEKKPIIDDKFLYDFKILMDRMFTEELVKRYKTESFLIKETMDFYIMNFLRIEGERINRQVKKIVFLEKEFLQKIKFSNKEIVFKCRIDRMDELLDDSFLVIDYKTGSNEKILKNLRLETSSLKREIINKQIKSFQLPLYTIIMENIYKNKEINACFCNIKEINDNIVLLFDEKNSKEEKIYKKNIYFQCLNFIIDEILNPEIPFVEDTSDLRYCDNCDFRYFCSV